MPTYSNPNWPTVAWQWDPAHGPTETTRWWRSLTARVASEGPASGVYNTSYGRQYELTTTETGTASAHLDNLDEALTPGNLSSPYQVMSGWVFRQGANTIVPGFPANTLQFLNPIQIGSLVLVSVIGTAAATSVGISSGGVPTWGGKTFQQLASVNAGGYFMSVWGSIANVSGNVVVQTTSTGTWTAAAAEYVGTGDIGNLDVVASTSLTGGSFTSVGTGTTAAAQAGDLLFVAAGVANWASASTPTAPTWAASTQRVAATSPASGTAALNSIVFLGDQLNITAGAKSDTASWTNAGGTALGIAVTFKRSPTVSMASPPAGSMATIPYRPLRHWAMWPPAVSGTGNLLNATNNPWAYLASVNGSFADTASFEGGTTGTWWVDRAQAIANSSTRAHDGTKSMVVTWPTATSGTAYVSTDLPPVETGYTYTLSAWVYVPAGTAGALLQWGTINGTGSAVTNAWTRISVTVTRGDGQDDRLYLVTTGNTTAGQQIWVDSVQVEIAASPSAFQTTGSTVYALHSGYIERYPETWSHNGYYGWESVTSVDALALLAARALQDCMTEDILLDAPAFYWPLSDKQPTGGFCLPYGAFYGVEWISNFYLNVPSIPFKDITMGATGGPGLDSLPCVQFSATGSSQPSVYFGPNFSSDPVYAINDTGSGVTWEVWFQTTGTSNVTIVDFTSNNLEDLVIAINSTGNVVVESYNLLAPRYTVTDPGISNDGQWHYVAVTETSNGTTVTGTVQVDGRIVGTGTYSAATGMQTVQIGLAWGVNSTSNLPFNGKMARVAVYATALSAARRRSHWASSLGFPWDTTGTRVSRVLDWMPWKGPRNIFAGITQMSPASGLSGRSVQDVINSCVATENAPFVDTPVGVLTQFSRDTYYLSQTPVWTFGENLAGGEIPYLPDVSAGSDITYVANVVTVTGASGNPQVAQDAASLKMYGPRTLSVSTSHARDSDALFLAQHLLNIYKAPRQRVITVTVDPAGNPTAWPAVLGVKFGDRVRFNRRTSAGATLSFDGFVDRIQHDVGVGSWRTSLQVSPADPTPPLILGDATYGVLGQNLLKY